jgi:hypothetical protein
MSEASKLDVILQDAEGHEEENCWSKAAEMYRKALTLVREEDFARKGETLERVGYAFYRAAMQAESQEEFRNRVSQAVTSYREAEESYKKSGELSITPRMLRCEGMIAYLGFWLESEAIGKKKLLDECWRQTTEALQAFQELGDGPEYGKTYNLLSISAGLGGFFEYECQIRERRIREAAEYGEQAIAFLNSRASSELTTAYVRTAVYLEALSYFIPDPNEQKKRREKSLAYWMKAVHSSEEKALLEFFYSYSFHVQLMGWEPGSENAITNLKKALEYGMKANDRFVTGGAMDWLACHTAWKASATEDPDERLDLIRASLKFAEDAKRQFTLLYHTRPRDGLFWAEEPYAEYYGKLGTLETDLGKRRVLLRKAVDSAKDYLERAEKSGYPDLMSLGHHILSNYLTFLAQMEDVEEKKRLLQEALKHRNESIKISQRTSPRGFLWNQGMILHGLSRIKSQLAELASDAGTKKKMLEEAILDKEKSLRLCTGDNVLFEGKGSASLLAVVGLVQYEYGSLLSRLHAFSKADRHLRKAIDAFIGAADRFHRLNRFSRAAECHWKSAIAYDMLGEHVKAAESFDLALDNYQRASENIPQLEGFYKDHAFYMQAWSEIEKSRYNHSRQRYDLASEHFERAAGILKSLKRWSYIAPNFSAWAQVENAEELSRKDLGEEALQAFKRAVELFAETENSINAALSTIEGQDERQSAGKMIKATEFRHEYCLARVSLEEAKILDKSGDHSMSSEKYTLAIERLEKTAQGLESEQDQKDIKFLISLSHAWQTMTRAEAEASPSLYIEASHLFEEAKELSSDEKTRMLTLGHSRFCRALEAGTRFSDSRDPALHAIAEQNLESAMNYYVKAGFANASEYAKATGLLFDAYVHLGNAAVENEPEKKAKLYAIAEKVLQTSANSYTRAQQPARKEQVLKLLDTVKEQRELAISLIQVLNAPIIASTRTFPSLGPTFEEAVGWEKFEHAEIQANIKPSQRKLDIGENLAINVELTNAGKGPALLIRVDEVIPNGFELVEKSENCRVEDGSVNLRGRRLDPLKTEEIKLVLKPRVQGSFALNPTILYLDENGDCKSHEPEPTNITVKELGIRDWLKGKR